MFLEIFSGASCVAAKLRHKKFPCIAFEPTKSSLFDLTHPAVIQTICAWIRHDLVAGIWLGTPCKTWSVACKPACRSLEHIWGLPDLPAHRIPGLELGNKTLRSTCTFIRCCIRAKVPIILENPQSSMMFASPPLSRLLSHPSCSCVDLTMCAFGTPWRKGTKLATWFANSTAFLNHKCSGKKCCSYTGRPHVVLQGQLCPRAAIYPPRFAHLAAAVLAAAAVP